jgi:hypothetical protein
MNIALLEERLHTKGCLHFLIGKLGDDVFCLIRHGAAWQVVYAERGFVREVLFESASEAEACEHMFQQIMRIRHDHVVGVFATRAEAEALSAALTDMELAHHIDRHPYSRGEPRFWVFVYGKSIFAARERFGALPLTNWPPTS